MASIQRRTLRNGEPSFRVMYRIDGRLVSDSFPDARAAERYRKLVEQIGGEAARETLTAHTISGGAPTLEDWVEHYLEHLTGATAGTVGEYRRLAKRTWLPTLGHLPVDTISRDAVRKWVGQQSKAITVRGTPTSAKTVENAQRLLSQVLAGAVEADLIPSNVAKGVALPAGTQEEMVFLTHAEFAKIVDAIDERWRPVILTIAGTGMRWGEASALHWRDVDLDADTPTITVSQAWKRGEKGTRHLGAPKSRKSRRRISLPPEVVAALRPLAEGRAPGDFVFTATFGGQLHHQVFHPRYWKPAVVKANIGKSPRIHDLRHSHASWLLAAGVPIHVVQHRLGHESITTTVDRYGHLMDDAPTIAARAASLALTSAMPEVLAIEG